MVLLNALRPTIRVLKSAVKRIISSLYSFRYRHLASQNRSSHEYYANLLVVKKPIYAKLARLCIESFLYFNPNCKVVVNVDSSTEAAVAKALRKLSKRRKVEIRNIGQEDCLWQEIKLELILGMRSTKEFFMDADLRWNGPMPQLDGITFFVNEFALADREPYPELIQLCGWNSPKEISMKNTSFLFWDGYIPSAADRSFIKQSMIRIQELCTNGNIGVEHNASLIRISEQVALSVMVDMNNQEVNFLKDKDGFRDGTFVESSYFGATGSAF